MKFRRAPTGTVLCIAIRVVGTLLGYNKRSISFLQLLSMPVLKCYTYVMISYIQGTVLQKTEQYLIVQVGGFGYKVFTTPSILESRVGDEVKLYTYQKIAEDGQSLFGLPDFETLKFFELLITVSGVGPKMALAILSASPAQAVQQAIFGQDPAIFTRISGVGLKTAEKIIVELKGKVAAGISANQPMSSDVFDALLALGYNQRQVLEVVGKLDAGLSIQEQIKQGLVLLGR